METNHSEAEPGAAQDFCFFSSKKVGLTLTLQTNIKLVKFNTIQAKNKKEKHL